MLAIYSEKSCQLCQDEAIGTHHAATVIQIGTDHSDVHPADSQRAGNPLCPIKLRLAIYPSSAWILHSCM
eukprot:48590-Pyramimonas_sp.AAC.1